MSELFDNIEVFLNVECGAVFSKNKLKFYRVHKNHHHGDYTCILWDKDENVDMSYELFENLLKEKRPLWKNFLKFSVTDGRVNVFINRTVSFANGIKNVLELGEQYGSNKLNNKTFNISLDNSFDVNSITFLRGKIICNILNQLISTSGGIIKGNEVNDILPDYKIIVTENCSGGNCNDINITLKVGSVLNGSDNNKKHHIAIDDYYKLRAEEIDKMCEHKLKINNVTSNREDLVQATIIFDLIQSNIHKSMTLRLENQNPDLKTSCKGALFVMYNYVRLITLITKFENLVSNKYYLPLPTHNEIDFSLLSEEGEWALMYDYVLCWPSVVKRSFEKFEEGRPKIHNICRFLLHFSSEFSVYYHRTRILTDPRPHLMSVLYARIHFLKAVAQVLKNALNLLLLQPLKIM